ncbi:MAG: hypothetical protein Q4A40_05705, partial [Bacillota bacterium]|nr:hypothetical protein [Bacillota bacterium]
RLRGVWETVPVQVRQAAPYRGKGERSFATFYFIAGWLCLQTRREQHEIEHFETADEDTSIQGDKDGIF